MLHSNTIFRFKVQNLGWFFGPVFWHIWDFFHFGHFLYMTSQGFFKKIDFFYGHFLIAIELYFMIEYEILSTWEVLQYLLTFKIVLFLKKQFTFDVRNRSRDHTFCLISPKRLKITMQKFVLLFKGFPTVYNMMGFYEKKSDLLYIGYVISPSIYHLN